MTEVLFKAFKNTEEKILQISGLRGDNEAHFRTQSSEKFRNAIEESLKPESQEIKDRIFSEYFSYGPLEKLFADQNITEILVNGPKAIWFERDGNLHKEKDSFLSDSTFLNCFHRISEKALCQSNIENPTATGQFDNFRLTIIRQELTKSHHHLSFRRHPKNPWTFASLLENSWAAPQDIENLERIMQMKKNFLIVGSTGSGKTSLINALLQTLSENERAVIIEDTPEIELPNSSCMKLITRHDSNGILKEVDQAQLLRHSLRLRPDRIIMGEIRGSEAKDLLMALATGHGGSFGSLHAADPRQALIRLEMLIQMGAPQWNIQAIRRLIQLSIDYVIVVEKSSNGNRRFEGVYKLCSLEENGFLIEKVLSNQHFE